MTTKYCRQRTQTMKVDTLIMTQVIS